MISVMISIRSYEANCETARVSQNQIPHPYWSQIPAPFEHIDRSNA